MNVKHLNTCVYELAQVGDKDMQPLTKQINNAVPVTEVTIEEIREYSFNQIKKMHTNAHPGAEVYCAYPFKEENYDDVTNWTVVHGKMIKMVRNDPNKPISVEGSPEEIQAARNAYLEPYPVILPFMIAFPETPRFMFDIVISHIPHTAITLMPEHGGPAVEGESLPLGLDPRDPYLDPEKMAEAFAKMAEKKDD